MKPYGDLLTEAMQRQGVTNAQVAANVGVWRNTVATWRRSKGLPLPAYAERLAEYLGTPALFDRVKEARQRICPIDNQPFLDGWRFLEVGHVLLPRLSQRRPAAEAAWRAGATRHRHPSPAGDVPGGGRGVLPRVRGGRPVSDAGVPAA